MSEFRKYGTDPKMDELVDSEDWHDRQDAARQCYGLEKLINDKINHVRRAVALQGYGLDILINDTSESVRYVIAEQGYGYDILVNDTHWTVRKLIAERGYGLNILINDEDSDVRYAVAKSGYGLDILINDIDEYVRDGVFDYLKENNYKSIDEWATKNPNKVHKTNIQDFRAREGIRNFIHKIDNSSKLKVESSYDNMDEFFDNNDSEELVICTVDTKQPIIKIQKTQQENKVEFMFIVDITTEDRDSFIIKTIIKSKEQLSSKIQETIESLKSQKDFIKYIDDLESCL